MAPNIELASCQPEAAKSPSESKAEAEVWRPQSASMKMEDAELVEAIRKSSKEGVLIVEDLAVAADFDKIATLMELLQKNPALGNRLNLAYTKNRVFKDSFGEGQGGDNVDQKRVLDTSVDRMKVIQNIDESLRGDLGSDFEETFEFFCGLDADVRRIMNALAEVVGDGNLWQDFRQNFRLVDYYTRPKSSVSPRCGEHRDFGPATLIFQEKSGLQIFRNGNWQHMPVPEAPNSAILLFGICSAWMSNDRVNAVKHRVVNSLSGAAEAQRRLSAVLFVGPSEDEHLAPVLAEGESAKWRSGKVKNVRQFVARKWRHREGTVSREEAAAEEELKKKLPTQDDAINFFYKM